MSKLLIILFSLLFIGCCQEPVLLKNGLTKSVSQITAYTFLIKRDSSNIETRDTTNLETKIYNDNDQITHLNQLSLLINEKMEIDYSYNEFQKLIKETVKLSEDSLPFTVDYFYKDTLLDKSIAIVNYPNQKFEQIETFHYRENNTIEKKITTQIFIDLETSDTLSNSISTSFYDRNEIATKDETVNKTDPKKSRKIVYKYDNLNIIGLKEYDNNDSLLSTLKYEYELDEFDNWIERRIIENGKLDRIISREIDYR